MSFCSNCGSSLSEGMKFCSSCGMARSEPLNENAPAKEKNIHVKRNNKMGVFKKVAVFIAISLVVLFAAIFYIDHKSQERHVAASNQLLCDTENDGEACFSYANYIWKEASAYDVKKDYLNKACTLIPKTDTPERLANICADAGNLEAACDLGNAKSCYESGQNSLEQFLETTGRKPRNEQISGLKYALATVLKSCELGYSEGCNLYVRSIFHSEYHYLDLGEISKHATQACEAGYQASCYFIKKGYFAAYGDIGELKNNAPLDYIKWRAPTLNDSALYSNLSGRCTAIVNISKAGTLDRIVDLSCNHNAFKKVMEEELSRSIYFPLLLDGRPERRLNETITKEYKIADERGRPYPFE